MPFYKFELEQWQSLYEHDVEYNLADSGVTPVTIRELLNSDDLGRMLDLKLHYPRVNGTKLLRERIAALYPAVTPYHVLTTVGAAEANQIVCQTLLEAGDRVVVMEPGYRQVWGIAKGIGCDVRPFRLEADQQWRPNLDELAAVATPGTKLIALVNPNNPTGSTLSPAEMERIIQIAARSGAWLLADEVYRGSEHQGAETPTFWGKYDRVIAINSLSKAYALSGLRLGWVVAPEPMIDALWRRHEYATIAATAPSMFMAEVALETKTRGRLIERQRGLSRQGWQLIQEWIGRNEDLVSVQPSSATALAFVRYHLDRASVAVADHLRQTQSVLVAPGSTLGVEGHLRITHGLDRQYVTTALDRISSGLRQLQQAPRAAGVAVG